MSDQKVVELYPQPRNAIDSYTQELSTMQPLDLIIIAVLPAPGAEKEQMDDGRMAYRHTLTRVRAASTQSDAGSRLIGITSEGLHLLQTYFWRSVEDGD